MTVLHAGLLNVWEEVGWGWLPAVPFLGHDAGHVVFAEGPLGEVRAALFGTDRLETLLGLPRPEGAAVMEHELVDRELAVLAAQELDRNGLPTGCFPNSLPDVALVDVDLSTLGEVEVLGPNVAVVADEFYFTSDSIATSLVLSAVVYVFTS
ncbi:MAG: hypothetical protein AB2556_25190, partial [Candidatus Thiodiazotropha sp.]